MRIASQGYAVTVWQYYFLIHLPESIIQAPQGTTSDTQMQIVSIK